MNEMKNIIVIGASNSTKSINKTLAVYAASKVSDAYMTVLDLNDYELPIYGTDLEKEIGIPEAARKFDEVLASADGLIISLAEHNGSYTAVFKNLIDWLSRIDMKIWKDIPMLLMATSPGGRGGSNVLATAKGSFPFIGGNVVADFSLPSYFDNFSNGAIANSELEGQLNDKIELFERAINELVTA